MSSPRPVDHILARLVAVLAALGMLLAAPRPAAAEEPDKATVAAKKHFFKGEKLFALGRFDDALREYEKAFEEKPLPAFLFNIGQCHRNLGDLDAAIFSFRKYLKLAPEADNHDAVVDLIDELERERERNRERAEAQKASQIDEVRATPKPRKHRPIYTRWWFWGGVAVAAGATAGGIYVLRDPGGIPDSDLGNIVFGK